MVVERVGEIVGCSRNDGVGQCDVEVADSLENLAKLGPGGDIAAAEAGVWGKRGRGRRRIQIKNSHKGAVGAEDLASSEAMPDAPPGYVVNGLFFDFGESVVAIGIVLGQKFSHIPCCRAKLVIVPHT